MSLSSADFPMSIGQADGWSSSWTGDDQTPFAGDGAERQDRNEAEKSNTHGVEFAAQPTERPAAVEIGIGGHRVKDRRRHVAERQIDDERIGRRRSESFESLNEMAKTKLIGD